VVEGEINVTINLESRWRLLFMTQSFVKNRVMTWWKRDAILVQVLEVLSQQKLCHEGKKLWHGLLDNVVRAANRGTMAENRGRIFSDLCII